MRVFNLNQRRLLSRGEKGQSLVEMTLGLMVLIILMSGLIDLGRAYFIYAALEDSAGEGALFMSFNPGCQDDTDCPDPNNAMWRIAHATEGLIDLNDPNRVQDITITVLDESGNEVTDKANYAVGHTIVVEIWYEFQLLSPIIPEIAGEPTLTLYTSATQTIIGD